MLFAECRRYLHVCYTFLGIRENGILTLKRYPRGVQKNYEIFFGARRKFSFVKIKDRAA
uniref:Uncharacterized protein n=1 Tax=Siphoviridae sp. ctNLX12 TaxID=2825469 RepID=A0A8S5UDX6_9CAUD|nr:MAG TPA: hypothetical protein [Siphoviridae sp. ctNLX12]